LCYKNRKFVANGLFYALVIYSLKKEILLFMIMYEYYVKTHISFDEEMLLSINYVKNIIETVNYKYRKHCHKTILIILNSLTLYVLIIYRNVQTTRAIHKRKSSN